MYLNTKLLGMVLLEQMRTITSFLEIPTKHKLDSINWGDNGIGEVIVVKYHAINSPMHQQNFWSFNYYKPEEITVDEAKTMVGFLTFHGVPYNEATDQINILLAKYSKKVSKHAKVIKSKAEDTAS